MRHPVVTYSGDPTLFSTVQSSLISDLPQEGVEWKRSYGRLTRSVHVEVDFVLFSEEKVIREQVPRILNYPIFHTFWTDCPDVDTYKASLRESLQSWVQILKQNGISDWMVIIVETPDSKKGNKLLPRTTVLDKLKNDFGGKQSERCISLIDQSKLDSRSAESWQLMLFKMRQLLMVAYNRALHRFEELMRAERERRNEKNWSFCRYFLLQEELAQVFNLLSLHEEALVQYDELDALFTQFVLNSAAGDTPKWIVNFSSPCENWEGFCLSPFDHSPVEGKIKEKDISLLEFRNYLFQQQCQLLIQLNKPWELASRALCFLHNTLSELRILDVSIYEGGVSCWGFLSCLEIINLLFKYKDPTTTDSHAVHTAPLWAYARDKLKVLGILCGLMPGAKTTSKQLHTVINLVCGMGNDPHAEDSVISESDTHHKVTMTPMTRLKDALSSEDAFMKHFLDISEVAISTYKHIGRIRSARRIGRDLALFYISNGSPQKAVPFLIDQLKTFLEEDWSLLTLHTHVELAKCYLATDDAERYIKTCIMLAASEVHQHEGKRIQYFHDMINATEKMEEDQLFLLSTDHIFEAGWMSVTSTGPIILGSDVEVELIIQSHLPAPLKCSQIEVQLRHIQEKIEKSPNMRAKGSEIERKCSTGSSSSQASSTRKHSSHSTPSRSVSDTGELSTHLRTSRISEDEEEDTEDERETNLYRKHLNMDFNLDYKQDKSLAAASVSCSNPHKILRRRDSHGGLENFEKTAIKDTFIDYLSANDITINPGENKISVSAKVSQRGSFMAGQIVLSTKKLQFICGRTLVRGSPLIFKVINENPRIYLGRKNTELLAGVPQTLVLTVNSGSTFIEHGTAVKLKASSGLRFKKHEQKEEDFSEEYGNVNMDEFYKEIVVLLPEVEPFQQITILLKCIADLKAPKEASVTEHVVNISSEFLVEQRVNVDVHFILPFVASYKLQTANLKKFVQVSIAGLVSRNMYLSNPQLTFSDSGSAAPLQLLNYPSQRLMVCRDYDINYLWELTINDKWEETPTLKANFTVNYHTSLDSLMLEDQKFEYSFDVQNYKSLYTLRTKVEPVKGSEFCRAGNMSHLNISLQQVLKTESGSEITGPMSIMYEVIADQTMWAVCGQSSGVLTMETCQKQNVMTEVMPLISGFLPLPSVRLSKYIPAQAKQTSKDGRKVELVGTPSTMPRLEPFCPGQVYNFSRALQVHVLPASNTAVSDIGHKKGKYSKKQNQ